jgi:hypothetical protein
MSHQLQSALKLIWKTFMMNSQDIWRSSMGLSVSDIFFGGSAALNNDWSQADFTVSTVPNGRWHIDFQV